MAEINTGLGWAANSDWLMLGTGTIAELTAFGIDGYDLPLPVTGGTAQEIVNNGVLIVDSESYEIYASASVNNCFVNVNISGVQLNLGFLSPDQTATVYFVSRNKSSGDTGTVMTGTRWTYAGQSHSVDFYHFDAGFSNWDQNMTTTMPQMGAGSSYITPYLAALSYVSTQFTKTNPGYAVACVAKWKTQNGTIISTPVLVSSVSEYTDMEDTSGQYNLAKLNVLRDGMRFYMSFFDIVGNKPIATNLPVLDLSGEDEPPRSLETVFAYIADLDHGAILVLNSPDPYEQETEGSGEEGGDGEDLEDDPVEEETLPLPSVAGHGFCTIYVPRSQELNQMASYLWGGNFDVSQVIKLFSNPMDSILGLSAVPVDLVGSPEQIYLGGVALTGITMPKYTGRTSVKVDFGSVTVAKRWGSYLDYSPYTDFSIYLPFIGIKSIKADDIMGKTVNLTYAIDILSGGCVAYLRPAGESVLYEWSGQCALQIPVTGRSYDNVFRSAMSVATAAVAAVAAPASAPVLSGAVASAAVQAAATKPHIERSGTVNGITGFLGQLRPYLIRTIPEAYIPEDQNKFIGYPAYINVDLASVKGYNEVDSIHLENVTATGAELEEIETILKGGVIF